MSVIIGDCLLTTVGKVTGLVRVTTGASRVEYMLDHKQDYQMVDGISTAENQKKWWGHRHTLRINDQKADPSGTSKHDIDKHNASYQGYLITIKKLQVMSFCCCSYLSFLHNLKCL